MSFQEKKPEYAIVLTSMMDVLPPDQKDDLTSVILLKHVQQGVFRNVDQWCIEYEEKFDHSVASASFSS